MILLPKPLKYILYFSILAQGLLAFIIPYFFEYIEFFTHPSTIFITLNIICTAYLTHNLQYAKSAFKISALFSIILIVLSAHTLYKTHQMEQAAFPSQAMVAVYSGTLKNTDDYTFAYQADGLALKREPDAKRGKPISVFQNDIDIEIAGAANPLKRIKLSCGISRYSPCKSALKEALELDKWGEHPGRVHVKTVLLGETIRNLIVHMEAEGKILDQAFFHQLYQKELLYYHRISIFFLLFYIAHLCMSWFAIRTINNSFVPVKPDAKAA